MTFFITINVFILFYLGVYIGVSSASPSSARTLGVGQNMGSYGYGSVTMEKNFRVSKRE